MSSELNPPTDDEKKPLAMVRQAFSGVGLSAGVYFLLTILSAGMVATRVVDYGTDWLLLILVVLLVAMLFFRVWLIGMIFLALLVFLNHTEYPYRVPGSTPFEVGEIVFAAACLAFIVFASRYIAMMAPIRTYGASKSTWRESVAFLRNIAKPQDEAKDDDSPLFDPGCQLGRRQKRTMRPDELVSSGFRILIGVGVGVAILQFVPLPDEFAARNEFRLRGPAVRVMTIGWVILTALFVLRFFTGPVRRSQSRREAELFLRGEATRGLFSELRAMVVRLVKHRQKTLVRRLANPIEEKPVEPGPAAKTVERPRDRPPPRSVPSQTRDSSHSTTALRNKLKRPR